MAGVRIPEGTPSRPWDDLAPPLPEGIDKKTAQQIATVFRLWRKARPTYVREGADIVCAIEYKGQTWQGRAPATNQDDDSGAAWLALNECIESWLDDNNLLRSLKKRLDRSRG